MDTDNNQNSGVTSNLYQGLMIYEVAKVKDIGIKYLVEYVTVSTIPWVTGENNFLPLNSYTAEKINEAILSGKEVYITKDWNQFSKEVLITNIEVNPVADLNSYKRRACTFIKSFINPMMASVHASVVYGFITLNNKFIERGYVFSEENRTLKYIDIMEKAEDLEESNPKLSQELMDDLEKYIEYKDTLARSNFIWNESEKYIAKIESIITTPVTQEDLPNEEFKCKQSIDSIILEFQNKINTLNNLK